MKDSQKNSPNSKKLAKPFSYVWGFFHPVSRSELEKSFENSRDVSKEAQRLISESKVLNQEIDRILSLK